MDDGKKIGKTERRLLYLFLFLASVSGIWYLWTDITDLLKQ